MTMEEELVPLKKCHLVGRLADLREGLPRPFPELDTVLRFASLLSYETLLSLAERILWMVQEDLTNLEMKRKRGDVRGSL